MIVIISYLNVIFISGAPVYISNPHFYQSDPKLLAEVEGLKPDRDLHETYFKIQPVSILIELSRLVINLNNVQKLGVPVEGKVRVQLNLRVEHTPAVQSVANFRDFVFPIMWLEEVSIQEIEYLLNSS